VIGEAPGLALMIRQLEVDRFFHSYGTRTVRLSREDLTQLRLCWRALSSVFRAEDPTTHP